MRATITSKHGCSLLKAFKPQLSEQLMQCIRHTNYHASTFAVLPKQRPDYVTVQLLKNISPLSVLH